MKYFVFLTCLMPKLAHADCAPATETFLSCTVKGGQKSVDVCLDDADLTYRFGPPTGAADLELRQPLDQSIYLPWNGIGRGISETVTLSNGAVRYSITGTIDKFLAEENAPDAVTGQILAWQDDQIFADLACDSGSVSFPWTDALFIQMTKDGQCWDPTELIWATCP